MGPALLPEYEDASIAFMREVMDSLMQARDELYRKIPKATVSHLPDRPTTDASAGYEAQLEPIEAVSVLRIDDLIATNLDAWTAMASESADQFLEQWRKQFFKHMEAVCQKGGTTFDARGGELSIDLLLDCVEQMELDFKADGTPAELTFVSPELGIVRPSSQFPRNEAQEKRYQQILGAKRKDFDARRRIRKLDRCDK
jgi:hypothetical protein